MLYPTSRLTLRKSFLSAAAVVSLSLTCTITNLVLAADEKPAGNPERSGKDFEAEKKEDDDLDDLDSDKPGDDIASGSDSGKEYVITLTESNFQDTVKKGRTVVEFYAPWCGHCKNLAPEYEAAAKILAANKRTTKLAKVDATVEQTLAQTYSVQGYPTLKYFVDGVESEYNGPRERDGIVEWVESREKDPVEVCTEKEYEEMTAKYSVPSSKVAYLIRAELPKKSGKTTALRKAISSLQTKSFNWVKVCLFPIDKKDEATKSKMVLYKLHSQGDVTMVKFPAKKVYNQNSVFTWMTDAMYSSVEAYRTPKFGMLQHGTGVKFIVTIAAPAKKTFDSDEELKKVKKEFVDEFDKIAASTDAKDKKIKSAVRFAVWEGEEEVRQNLGGSGGETKESLVVALEVGGGKKYTLKKPSTTELKPWLSKLIADDVSIKPDYKSQPLPDPPVDPNDGVRILVGSNFADVAFSPKTDVFVEFYAPWCGHCKQLAPEWSKLAKTLKELGVSEKKVTIAKMDATENESAVEVSGFPKIVLFPAVKNCNEKKGKEFKGGQRNVNTLMDFLAENAVNLENMDLRPQDGDKTLNKKEFSMVDRELAKKKKKTKTEEL